MAKNRNKKKKNDSRAMDITSDQVIADLPQAMDTSESAAAPNPPHLGVSCGKTKRGVQMKRSKKVRKMKAIARALSKNEKCMEKMLKNESRTLTRQSAKKLYD